MQDMITGRTGPRASQDLRQDRTEGKPGSQAGQDLRQDRNKDRTTGRKELRTR